MKQYITELQLNELSEKGKDNLKKWSIEKYGQFGTTEGMFLLFNDGKVILDGSEDSGFLIGLGDNVYLPMLSIGQMIEFLYDNKDKWEDYKVGMVGEEYFDFSWYGESLCDYLWEAIKEVLNKE